MSKTNNYCPSCGFKRNPAVSLCPKCNKDGFLSGVKNGLNPFDHMSAGRVVWIALIATIAALIIPMIAYLFAFVEQISLGNLDLNATDMEGAEALIQEHYPSLQALSMLLGQIGAFLLILIVARRYLSAIIASFKNYKNILKSIAIIAAMFAVSLLWSFISDELFVTTVNENQQLVEQELLSFPVISFFSTVIFAPLLEEITYRCGIFGLIRRKSYVAALIISAILFALIHIDLSGANLTTELLSAPDYLLCGFTLGYIYHKYGLPGSFIAHLLNNLIASIFVFAGI